jgi:2-polyprenyl-3-methyl-5-hydroxy-6-metoxy-1,4-benzoquinol methylase
VSELPADPNQQAGTQDTGAWPASELEQVLSCPVCGSDRSQLLYEDLVDNQFFTAPGHWAIDGCLDCGSGYLNPRPTATSIGRAYRRYYTHANQDPASVMGWIKRAIANGYRNHRYGTSSSPSTRLGVLYAWLAPGQRALADARMRHLPKPLPGGRVLDVGCGSGAFLELAGSAGWDAVGLEVDPEAVRSARSRGLDVRQGEIDTLLNRGERFTVITLSHVLEHVHEPLRLLQACRELLEPEGWLWLEVPNFEAPGRRRFGRSWLHLDPPRHLTHFTLQSLSRLLAKAGFDQLEQQPHRPLCHTTYSSSEAVQRGLGNRPRVPVRIRLSEWFPATLAEWKARRHAHSREFCTLKAYAAAAAREGRPATGGVR